MTVTGNRFRPFVEADFAVPTEVERPGFRLSMLTTADLLIDYVAVIANASSLQGLFDADDPWPHGLTLEQNLVDLGWHEKEFQRRTSFAYKVTDPASTVEWGCIYLYPPADPAHDVDLIWWTRADLEPSIGAAIDTFVPAWVDTDWPFANVNIAGHQPRLQSSGA